MHGLYQLYHETALLIVTLLFVLSLLPGLPALFTPSQNRETDPHELPFHPPYENILDTSKAAVKVKQLYIGGYSRTHPELCPEQGAHVQVVILVTSSPEHNTARNAIRLTWGHYNARSDVAIAFVLGAPPADLKASIDHEDEIYGDLIVGSYVDSYTNLTLKSLSILEWINDYCSRARRLLKTDDDVFINVPRLIQFASSSVWAKAKRTIWGRRTHKWLPSRDPDGKYYVPFEEFPGIVFPDHVTGPAYLLTVDCVRPLLSVAMNENYMRLEDVFLTGIVAKQLGIRRMNVPEFYNRKLAHHSCAIQLFISVHQVRYNDQFDMWSKQLDGKTHCNNIKTWPP